MMKGRRLLVLTSASMTLAVFAVPGVAVAKQGGTDRPVQGSGTSTDTVDLATAGGTGDGTALISHLGRSTYRDSFTVRPTGPNTLAITGVATFTAANGDQLYATLAASGTLTGLAVGDTGHITGAFTITGGTGRFANASGALTAKFDARVASLVGPILVNHNTYTLTGRISY